MAGLAGEMSEFEGLFSRATEKSKEMVAAISRLVTALNEAKNEAHGILPVLELLLQFSEEQIELENTINKLKEKRSQLTEAEQKALDVLLKIQADKQSLILAQGEEYFETLSGTTLKSIELEKNFRSFLSILARSGEQGRRLAASLISMKATKEAAHQAESFSRSIKGAVDGVLNLEQGLMKASGFFANMSLKAFFTSQKVKDLSKNLFKISGGGVSTGKDIIEETAINFSNAVTKNIKKSTDSASKNIEKGERELLDHLSVTAQSAGVPIAGAVLSGALMALALSLKYAKTRMDGATAYVNASLGRVGSESGMLYSSIKNYGKDFVDKMGDIISTFLVEDEEAKNFVIALNKVGIKLNESGMTLDKWRKAQLASGMELQEFTARIGELVFATGVTGGMSEKLNKALSLQYTATGKVKRIQEETGISMNRFNQMWVEASSGLSQYVQNQDYLLNAVEKATVALNKMGFNATTAGQLIATMGNSFANVNDAIKILSMPGRGLEAIAEFEGLDIGEKQKIIMGGPIGQFIQGIGSTATQMILSKGLLGMDYSTAYKMFVGGLTDLSTTIDKTALDTGKAVGSELKPAIEEVAGELKKLERFIYSIEKHVANAADGVTTLITDWTINNKAFRTKKA